MKIHLTAKLAARAIDLYKMDRGLSKLTKKEEKDVKKEAAKAISKTKKSTESDIPKKKFGQLVRFLN